MSHVAGMKRALLLFGHPDHDSFNHRLAERYAAGFAAGGGQVERIDLVSLSFDPILRHGYRVPQPLEPDLERARRSIEQADHLVWVFPTYWASPPALVRGLVDRLFLPGWAFRFGPESSLPEGLLKGRSARVITTMDTPGWWYTAVSHRCLHRSFGSATLAFSGLAPVGFTAIHGVRELDERRRALAAAKVERVGTSDARRRSRRAAARPVDRVGGEEPRALA